MFSNKCDLNRGYLISNNDAEFSKKQSRRVITQLQLRQKTIFIIRTIFLQELATCFDIEGNYWTKFVQNVKRIHSLF